MRNPEAIKFTDRLVKMLNLKSQVRIIILGSDYLLYFFLFRLLSGRTLHVSTTNSER